MNWIFYSPLIAIAIAVIISLQGLSLLIRSDQSHVRWFGLLSILLGLIGMIGASLFLDGSLVLSPEFGVIMVQGVWPRRGLQFLLVCMAVLVGLGWHTTRQAAGWKSRLRWLVLVSIAVGGLSATQLVVLNPEDQVRLQIHLFDFWWPPMMIWIAAGLLEMGLTVLRLRSLAFRIFVASLLLIILYDWAVAKPILYHPYSEPLWFIAFILAVIISMFFATIVIVLAIWRAIFFFFFFWGEKGRDSGKKVDR